MKSTSMPLSSISRDGVKPGKISFTVASAKEQLQFFCLDDDEMNEWIGALTTAIRSSQKL
jgi:hypothetical protein